MTISDLQKIYRDKLATVYSDGETKSITKLVFEKILQVDSLYLSLDRFRILTTDQKERLEEILQRLLTHEPVQYILEEADFCELKFIVNKRVLIPRPETEELVYWIEELVKDKIGLRILDICTGSGCIAIALAKKFPDAIVEGCDISEEALKVAEENNALNKTKVNFFKLDILKEEIPARQYDIIVSNPPYITQDEKKKMSENVLQFEPDLALFAPLHDSLIFYREIGQKAAKALTAEGKLFFEINQFAGNETVDLLKTEGYKKVLLKKDINGADRMVLAEK